VSPHLLCSTFALTEAQVGFIWRWFV